jgi:hypothetical protein
MGAATHGVVAAVLIFRFRWSVLRVLVAGAALGLAWPPHSRACRPVE